MIGPRGDPGIRPDYRIGLRQATERPHRQDQPAGVEPGPWLQPSARRISALRRSAPSTTTNAAFEVAYCDAELTRRAGRPSSNGVHGRADRASAAAWPGAPAISGRWPTHRPGTVQRPRLITIRIRAASATAPAVTRPAVPP